MFRKIYEKILVIGKSFHEKDEFSFNIFPIRKGSSKNTKY